MRAEYFCTHARLRNSALVVRGKKTAELAGLNELVREMGQHGLHPNMIADPIRQRILELEKETLEMRQQGYRLGGGSPKRKAHNDAKENLSARELALASAERRAREQKEREKKNG